jgi:hypothetical protein
MFSGAGAYPAGDDNHSVVNSPDGLLGISDFTKPGDNQAAIRFVAKRQL